MVARAIIQRSPDEEPAGREELHRLAREQSALRRVATLVAEGAPPGTIFAAVAQEVGTILDGADHVVVSRYDRDTAEFVGTWKRTGEPLAVGLQFPIGKHNLHSRISRPSVQRASTTLPMTRLPRRWRARSGTSRGRGANHRRGPAVGSGDCVISRRGRSTRRLRESPGRLHRPRHHNHCECSGAHGVARRGRGAGGSATDSDTGRRRRRARGHLPRGRRRDRSLVRHEHRRGRALRTRCAGDRCARPWCGPGSKSR